MYHFRQFLHTFLFVGGYSAAAVVLCCATSETMGLHIFISAFFIFAAWCGLKLLAETHKEQK